MAAYNLYYITNRKHKGKKQFEPTGYGNEFSLSHPENLRFGKVSVEADTQTVRSWLEADNKYGIGNGNGEELSRYLAERTKVASSIVAFEEKLDKKQLETAQPDAKLGSKAMFDELQSIMLTTTDVVVFIHGFNVSWEEAVGSALALQEMLNRKMKNSPSNDKTLVVLFTWPSDGAAVPYYSYLSDRHDSEASSNAFARGILKLRDFLINLQIESKANGRKLCHQDIHLLCHSMGNFLLEQTLKHLYKFTPNSTYPRIFDQIFLCAPDVEDNALEPGQALGDLPQLANTITLYFNRGDVAMNISKFTKAFADRLGRNGAARASVLHQKIHQVDCSLVVKGEVEHSYYLSGVVNDDIYESVVGVPSDGRKQRKATQELRRWELRL